jgi:hypothetical protein
MQLSESDQAREAELLATCKVKQGEYLPWHHGRGSWATTYSNEFISAAKELYLLYEKVGHYWPAAAMSRRFRDAGIRSCRGSEMSIERVEYLYNAHLKGR